MISRALLLFAAFALGCSSSGTGVTITTVPDAGTPDARDAGGTPDARDAGGSADATCSDRDHSVLRYEAPGCGGDIAPVCGSPGMLGCISAYLCLCDGTKMLVCELWSPSPWAYSVKGRLDALVDGGATCDPTKPPTGADAGPSH